MYRALLRLAIALLVPGATHAEAPQPAVQAGDVFQIRSENHWTQTTSEGSTANSNGGNLMIERIVAVRDEGVELEFDFPPGATADDRASQWQFPVRVLRPATGPLRLLNGPELEARVDRWLAAGRLTREACGRWFFTWNAFKIECDPQSVIESLAALDLRVADLRDGAPYRDVMGLGPAVLRRERGGPDGATFVARVEVDPDAVRRQRTEMDAVVSQIVGDGPGRGAEPGGRAAERVSGTITVTLEADAAGQVRRRTRVTELEIVRPDGVRESQTFTDSVERRRVRRRR